MTQRTLPGLRDRLLERGSKPVRRRRIRWTTDQVVRRTVSMTLVFALAFAGVAFKLYDVQVNKADHYAAIGAQQRDRTVELPARRGRLYDREGEVLATSIDAATVFADPRVFLQTTREDGLIVPAADDLDAAVAALAPLLGREPDDVRAVLSQDRHFVYLGRQLDWEVGESIKGLGIAGVGVISEPRRVYPGGGLAGQILGFTGIDGDGLHGLELQHESVLSGEPGTLALERAPGGLSIASAARELVDPRPGTDLVLTIDREIQHQAERVAEAAVADFNAVGASIVVLEVATGDVLAMASAPGFDPNSRTSFEPEMWRNRAVTDSFEPGSVQKAITAAAAIEAGIVTADTVMMVPDNIRVGNKTFTDSHDHPPEEMTFRQIIETSSNVGTIMVAQQLGEERLSEALADFGYNSRLGVGFPGEANGLLMPVDSWWSTSLPTIAIGQGVAVTLLQSASFYATIANGGIATQPRILRGTIDGDGRLDPASSGTQRRVLSPSTSTAMRQILTGVVAGERGTGKAAAIPGYDVAGKTGTARKPDPNGRGYSGKYVATFVGFAPANNPEIVVAVMVDEPYPIWGGVVAAPAFASVMEFALRHRRVAPSNAAATIAEVLDRADLEAAKRAAIEAAKLEGPATPADETTSPVAGEVAVTTESPE